MRPEIVYARKIVAENPYSFTKDEKEIIVLMCSASFVAGVCHGFHEVRNIVGEVYGRKR